LTPFCLRQQNGKKGGCKMLVSSLASKETATEREREFKRMLDPKYYSKHYSWGYFLLEKNDIKRKKKVKKYFRKGGVK